MTKLLFLYDAHTSTISLQKAINEVHVEFPNSFELDIVRQQKIDQDDKLYQQVLSLAQNADFIFIVAHGGISYFKKFNAFFNQFQASKKFFFHSGISDEVNELLPKLNISAKDYSTVYKYYEMGGVFNCKNLILFLGDAFSQDSYAYEAPKAPEWEGIYHNSKSSEQVWKDVSESKKPVIAILFHVHYITNNNLKHINALTEAIEAKGATSLPIYTGVTREPEIEKKGIDWVIKNYLMRDGKPMVDVVINTVGLSMTVFNNAGSGDSDNAISVFYQLGVPVIQAFSTYFNYEKWKKSITGLDSMSLVSGIYMPEMDGQIGSYPIATHEYSEEYGAYLANPIPDRLDKVAQMAINWSQLQRKPAKDKKVAIIFHNMPPRNDMIGCAWGLDSPASVYHVIKRLEAHGVYLDYNFEDGDDIINRIIDAVSNDTTWKSVEDMLAESIDVIDTDTYQEWFDNLPDGVRLKLQEQWGDAPGEFMAHDGKLPVPGILNGNIFIGLQPPRAFDEKADEAYHSTDIVCPHQYIAFYKWVKHIFKADFIMHIGTHGTLEWLPGKEKGLSNECYPDFTIQDIPHLYIYNISVLGEGIQAKRRASAVILDHNIPSLTESGTYLELAELDDLLKDYQHSQNVNEAKLPALETLIWEKVVSLNLHQDLDLPASSKPENFEVFVGKLHSWVEKIKMSVIKDGLHTFGHAPEGEQFTNMLRQLVRIKNGDIMSINQGVAETQGFDYEDILDNPDRKFDDGTTGYMLIEKWTEYSKSMIEALHQHQYEIEDLDHFINYHLSSHTQHPTSNTQHPTPNTQLPTPNIQHPTSNTPHLSPNTNNLKKTLQFIKDEVSPRIERLTEELDLAILGSKAKFVAPGPGGCPTRGNALILPSGRNFFSIDPATLPTRASWDVGVRMAKDLIKKYQEDEGHVPESIAIVLYSGDQMKTNGDDIGEILYLMGVRPVWLGSTARVTGLEIISLEELGRPRIDVTCRISGLFRDTFPNLIELLDDAVTLVAALDEPVDQNFIRKHVQEETEQLMSTGMDRDVAQQESMLRVFGCPPGTYGGGVDILVDSKKWESNEDLADISVTWSSHAYSNKIHGDKRPDLYTRRLSKTEVTVKNEISVESDIYDIDDEFIYHGGMLAAVKKHSGKTPRSYYGNSANPERTQIADIKEETARIVRARILNPKWIEGLKRHGYKGASDVSYLMDNVFGWDATADIVEDWMYEEMTQHFLMNEENRNWMDQVNPHATHHIVERLLEAAQRGMWNAKEETLEQLKELYLECEGNLEGRSVRM